MFAGWKLVFLWLLFLKNKDMFSWWRIRRVGCFEVGYEGLSQNGEVMN